jgi:hypothetical protein
MNLKCCLNSIHYICKNSYFVCPLQASLEDIKGVKLACYECISSLTDYSGSFKCIQCEQMHQIKQLKAANQIYETQLQIQFNEIANKLLNKLCSLRQEWHGIVYMNEIIS